MFSFKNILKATSVYTLLSFLPTASRIFLLPIYLLYLHPDDFAIIGLFSLVISILPLFMTMGLEHSFIRKYYDYQKKPELLNSYISTILLTIIVISVVLSLLFFPFGNQVFSMVFKSKEFSFQAFGAAALISSFFSGCNGFLMAYFRNRQEIRNYSAFSGGQFVLTTGVEFLVIVIFNFKPVGIVWAKVISSAVVTLITSILLLKKVGIACDYRFLKPSFSYALPLIPYTILGTIFNNIDRIMIENRLDLTSLAVYNVSIAIANITDTFMFAIQSATYPTVYELLKKDMNLYSDKISKIYRLIGVVVLLIMTGIIAVAPLGIAGFLRTDYLAAIPLIPIILISYAFRYLYIVYAEPIFFFKKTIRLPLLTIIGGLITVIGNILLIPLFGLAGAAFSFVFSKVFILIPTYWMYIKVSTFRFNLSYIHPLLWIVFLFSILVFSLVKLFGSNHIFVFVSSFFPLTIVVSFLFFIF